MDKKRVFNAAVTAGLSLSMVLTSVPATALANSVGVNSPVNQLVRAPQTTSVHYIDPFDYEWSWISSATSTTWDFDPTETDAVSHEGYTFVGWAFDQSGEKMVSNDGMAELIASGTENVNVFAVWAPIEGRLNITFLDSMDSEYSWTWNGAPASDWYFDPTTSGAMNHPGYAFAGWSYSPDGHDMVSAGDLATTTGDVTLYAQWKEVETPASRLNITFKDALNDAYSWTWTGAPADNWYFNPTESGAMEHEGYTFAGWSYSPDGHDMVSAGDLATTTGDVTLYAQWAEVEEPEGRLNITFLDSMDSEYSWTWNGAPASDWYFDPTTSGAMNHPGYAFAGWSYSPDGHDMVSAGDLATTTGDVTLYAQWDKIPDEVAETHTVTFVDKYNGTKSTVEVEDGEFIAKPADPTFPGYTFVGWSTDGFEYNEYGFNMPVNDDLVLYASYMRNTDSSDPVDPSEPSTPMPGDDIAKPAGNEQAASDSKKEDSNVPETGDTTNAVAVTGIGIAGLMAAAASFILRRRNEQ